VMVPFFSAIWALPDALKEVLQQPGRAELIYKAVSVLVVIILAGHFVTNIARSFSGNIAIYQYALQEEITLKR